jgi:hypothetical protein
MQDGWQIILPLLWMMVFLFPYTYCIHDRFINKATLLCHQYVRPAILFYKLPLQIEDYTID